MMGLDVKATKSHWPLTLKTNFKHCAFVYTSTVIQNNRDINNI